jgi:hypothetical protein
MIRFSCPHCGQGLSAEERLAEREVKCGSCWQQARVPGVGQTTEYERLPPPTARPQGSGFVAVLLVLGALVVGLSVVLYLFLR